MGSVPLNEHDVVVEYGEYACAYARSLGWYLPGSEIEDIEQEALIALLAAARSYDRELGPSFKFYAAVVIRRRLASALKIARRDKHRPLNESQRVSASLDDSGDLVESVSLLHDQRAGVHELAVVREELRAILACSTLSPLEARAVFGTAAGYSAQELSVLLSNSFDGRGRRRFRDIDNAVQRGRRKLREAA